MTLPYSHKSIALTECLWNDHSSSRPPLLHLESSAAPMRIRCFLKVCCPGRRVSANFPAFLPIPSNHLARPGSGYYEAPRLPKEFHLNSLHLLKCSWTGVYPIQALTCSCVTPMGLTMSSLCPSLPINARSRFLDSDMSGYPHKLDTSTRQHLAAPDQPRGDSRSHGCFNGSLTANTLKEHSYILHQ